MIREGRAGWQAARGLNAPGERLRRRSMAGA